MTKGKIALLGAAMGAALVAGIGAAGAQDYYSASDSARYQRTYNQAMGYDRNDNGVETVIVRPDDNDIHAHRVLGGSDLNGVEYSLSRSVNVSDLDLANPADRAELRIRIHETALDVCAELHDRVRDLQDDRSSDRQCVRTASRNAMRDVMERYG